LEAKGADVTGTSDFGAMREEILICSNCETPYPPPDVIREILEKLNRLTGNELDAIAFENFDENGWQLSECSQRLTSKHSFVDGAKFTISIVKQILEKGVE